jgi:queuine/archaeosine tRNA-ribosyltransferase
MADLYLIYAREDFDFAKQLVNQLHQHWSVWWDYDLVGDFQQVIEAEMPRSKCVIVLWSESSRKKPSVRDEVRLAQENDKNIIGIKLDGNPPPYPYGQYSCVELSKEEQCEKQPGFQQLLTKVISVVPPTKPPARQLLLEKINATLPAVFLSVSSHETQLGPVDAIRALRIFNTKTILVSAYDFEKTRRTDELVNELSLFRGQGGIVILDSGNYEKSRVNDDTWTLEKFHEVLEMVPHDAAFSFDIMASCVDVDDATASIVDAVRRDSQFTNKPIFPIVHASQDEDGRYVPTSLIAIVRNVSKVLKSPLIAFPERELGDGLLQRVRCMLNIRASLNEFEYYQPVHLLGTGDPWSIAPLAAAGADSFDGLEWCRKVIDRQDHRLHHFHHFDFFSYQAELAESQITVAAIREGSLDYGGKVAFHNLDYFSELTRNLQSFAARGNLLTFLADILPKSVIQQIRREIKELSP